MARSSNQRDRGAAAVEFALVLPLLLLVLFGLIDFGRMLNAQITLTEAAREGARADALSPPGSSSEFVDGQVKSRVDLATQNLNGTVKPQIDGYCPAGDDDAKVTTDYTFEFVTPVGAIAKLMGGTLDGQLQLTGVGVMPCRG